MVSDVPRSEGHMLPTQVCSDNIKVIRLILAISPQLNFSFDPSSFNVSNFLLRVLIIFKCLLDEFQVQFFFIILKHFVEQRPSYIDELPSRKRKCLFLGESEECLALLTYVRGVCKVKLALLANNLACISKCISQLSYENITIARASNAPELLICLSNEHLLSQTQTLKVVAMMLYNFYLELRVTGLDFEVGIDIVSDDSSIIASTYSELARYYSQLFIIRKDSLKDHFELRFHKIVYILFGSEVHLVLILELISHRVNYGVGLSGLLEVGVLNVEVFDKGQDIHIDGDDGSA